MGQSDNRTIQLVFFGTNTFACTILQALIDAENIDVTHVVTRADKPVGRKRVLTPPPVKQLAETYDITVEQPRTLKDYDTTSLAAADVAVTAEYGALIPRDVLDAPKHGMLNVHTSLLPKYRGASPVQSAILHGDTETGVTIMKMDEGLDTGPIILQKKTTIDPDETALDLNKKLATLGADALLAALPRYINGELIPEPQEDAYATTCRQLTRDDGRIDWQRSAQDIYNQFRALTPWPGVFTSWDGKRLKLLDISPILRDLPTGTVAVEADQLFIGCGENALAVKKLQLEGKQAQDTKTFLCGHSGIDGNVLGN